MKTAKFFILLVLIFCCTMAAAQIDSDAEVKTTEAEKNDTEDVQSAAQSAAQRFIKFMYNEYDGVATSYETVVDGKTFRFVIKVEVSKDFINIMRAAEAVCFVDDGLYQRAIMVWLHEDSPIWSLLVPGFLQKYKSHFRRIIYYPAQQEFNNPLNDNVIEVEDCEFYEWVDPED